VTASAELTRPHPGRSLLIVEDTAFLESASRARTRGFTVTSGEQRIRCLAQIAAARAGLRRGGILLGDGTALDVVSALKRKRPDARTIRADRYGQHPTAVTAVKDGAVDILCKVPPTAELRLSRIAGKRYREGPNWPPIPIAEIAFA